MGEKDIETRMAIVSVVVGITVVIVNMISEETVKFIGQWLIENMVKPVGQLLIEKLVKPIGQWLGYLFHYSSNIENMKEQVKKLRDVRERVPLPHSVDAATRNIEEIETDVNKWLANADLIMGKAKEVIKDEEKSKMRCSYAICLNLKQRHQQSKKAKKIVQDINEVLKNWRDKVFRMDYMNFGSRMVTVKELMVALVDANINMIGVWGMAGVGKSTLVREIAKQVKEKKLFDEVAIATVTHKPDLLRIQGEIADKLDLKLDKETLSGRADLLRKRLAKENTKILVILDDIWEKLDLNEIGIPYDRCKIVVTSRNRDILSSEMEAQKDFGLEVLPKEEAWCLFEKLSGDSLKELNLRSKAMEVSIACAGLPLALVTVAKALRNKCFFEWEDALRQLRRPSPRNQKRMQEVIYSAIKLSYSHLESPELQSFFLFCAQNQVSSSIHYQDVLKKSFGLRLFHGISTLEEARNRIYTLVRSLKDSGLLIDAPDTDGFFGMHDLTRDVALLISYETQNVLTVRDEGLVEWPDEDDMKMCTAIFVFKRDIYELLDRLECPELRCLYVYAKDRGGSFKISDTFFKGMRKLKVLDLTYMRLSSLPSSLILLTNLQTLCLDQCVLGDIALIGEMKNLEILSLMDSEFKQLPREIGHLTHLRMLDLSDCKKLQVIPANVLSSLKLLEELYVGNSFTQWEVEGLNNERASLAELKHLSRLSTLEVHIPDANMMPKDLLFEKLKRYKIFIGDVWDWSDKHENSRVLKLKLNTCNQLESGIEMLFNGIEDLCLDELNGVKSIVYELDIKGFQQLKHLHVQNNAEIKYIIHSRRGLVIDDAVFPALKILSLKNMINLDGISDAQLPSTSFRDIRIMKVEHCEKLKFVFSSSIAKGLSQLQELEIKECNIMRAIVVKEDGDELEDRDVILFPQLRHLELQCLPKLMSFLSTQNSIITDVGEIIHKGELDFQEIPRTGMQPLFNEEVVFPNLETLELSSIHSEEILLHNQHRAISSFKLTDSRFQNLCNLTVKGSGNLKYLLSSSTATFMVQLKSLDIEDCKVMEEVLLTEDLGEEEIIPKVLFCRLEVLILKDLPVLKRFCVGSNIKFPSLKVTVIEKCPKLFIFKPVSSDMTLSKELKEVNSEEISQTDMQPLFNEEVAFSNLEDICISDKDNLKMLWHNHQLVPDSFCKLKKLRVSRCKILINIFSPNMLRRLQNLEELEISDCNSVEEVFDIRGVNVDEICGMVSNKLRVLRLFNLSKLKHVWSSDLQAIVTFQNLHTIKVSNCKSLKSLFPVSVAKSLEQLKSLTIHDCGLEEIVAMEEGLEIVTKFVFPRLLSLSLFSLPELKCFYPEKHTSEWSSLNWLSISKCDKVKIFALNELSFSETDELGHHVPVQQPLFLIEKVAFSNLENIYITAMDNLKMLWHNHQLAPDSFSKLKMLNVSGCKNLINIFPPNMLRRLQNLEELRISDCNSVEEVFDIRGVSVDEICDTVSTQLRVLRLFNLPTLKHVWSLDPQAIVTFQNLHEVVVSNCKSLKCLFSVSMAKNREQLESLTIGDCGSEEIVAMEGVETMIKFPRITSLHLEFLPKLKCFYPRKHTLEWPSLRSLRIYNCGKGNIIAPNELSFQERDELGHHVLVQQPLFPIEKDTLSNLEELKLDWDDTINQTYGRLKAQFSCKLKVLWLYSKDRWTAFPWVFVQGLYNLKKLDISNFFLEEICPCGIVDNEGQYAEMFGHLTTLHLSKMPKLMHLWKENSQQGRGIQNLESLYVSECGRLKILVPTSMYFQNLNTLEVSKCHGLISLATSSTVKSLVQLKALTISDCKRMREIVTNEGEGEAGDEICFNQLNFLSLYDLPTLGSFFHLGNRTTKLPSLRSLYVTKCPELKIFSNGVLSMPKLCHVGLDGNYWWARQSDLFPVEDVNTFIKRCWEKNNDPCLRQLFTQKTNASTSKDGEENDVDDLEDNST